MEPLKDISNLLCGLFSHLYLISLLILPPYNHCLTIQVWPNFLLQPKLQYLSSLGQIQVLEYVFKLWMCLSVWEVFSYVEVLTYFSLIHRSSCLLCQNIKKKKNKGLAFQLFVLHAWTTLLCSPWSPEEQLCLAREPIRWLRQPSVLRFIHLNQIVGSSWLHYQKHKFSLVS